MAEYSDLRSLELIEGAINSEFDSFDLIHCSFSDLQFSPLPEKPSVFPILVKVGVKSGIQT